MATTVGTTQPMKAMGGISQGTVRIMHFPATDNSIAEGDLVILTNGKLVVDNAITPATGVIVGVAMGASSAANDMIPVALAMSNQLFEASMIAGSGDETGIFVDNIGVNVGTAESADGYACLDETLTTPATAPCRTLRYAKQMNATQDTDPVSGGVGVTNPRVQFVFINSLFTGIETNVVV